MQKEKIGHKENCKSIGRKFAMLSTKDGIRCENCGRLIDFLNILKKEKNE